MVTFVLLVSGATADSSAAELGARTARQAAWVGRLREQGRLTDGGRIEGSSVRIRLADGGRAVIDVPPDAIGAVRSWLLVEVADLNAAVALAETCPEAAYGDVRVLAIDD